MSSDVEVIAVTGANGFIGANLVLRLQELGKDVRSITRATPAPQARDHLACASVIFHLAGVNRCDDEREFLRSNRDYTQWLANSLDDCGHKPLIVYSSSAKALDDTPYGNSKWASEQVLLDLAASGGAIVSLWRLPNLCGKWSRPNYNSVVATFCHNIARQLPLQIDDRAAPLSLLHVDDLVEQWLELLSSRPDDSGYGDAHPVYQTSVGEVADLIHSFAASRLKNEVVEIGSGLSRILYASYIAALPLSQASYPANSRSDPRGTFVEMLRTVSSGQFSYFSAHPGVTRGGHYHHSKVEKFLVAHGTGRFRFRNARNGEYFELVSCASEPLMIETIPGWAHDVTNIGQDELVVLTWANEQFDPERPDTHPMAI